MKNTWLPLLAVLLISALTPLWGVDEHGFSCLRSDATEIDVQFDLPAYKLVADGSYSHIETTDGVTIGQPGMPDLPLMTCSVGLPNQGAVTVDFEILGETTVDNVAITPAVNDENSAPTFDSSVYNNNILFPQVCYDTSDPGIMRTQRVMALRVIPFRYNDAQKQLRIVTQGVFHVHINARGTGINEITQPISAARSRGFDEVERGALINYSSIQQRDPVQQPSILFIYPNQTNVLAAMQSLIDWKKRMGYVVYTASTAVTGTTTTAIRNYILTAYTTWTIPPEFVVLCGDTNGTYAIPTWYRTWDGSGNHEGDHQYAMLVGDDEIEDVFIGRLSYQSINELVTEVNKICGGTSGSTINSYERNPYMSNTAWLNRTELVAQPSASGYSSVSCMRYVQSIIRAYNSSSTFFEDLTNDTNSVVNHISSGVSFVAYRTYYWPSSGFSISSLTNTDMLPFCTLITCATGNLDDTACPSEQIVRMSAPTVLRGAIACVGSSSAHTQPSMNCAIVAGTYAGLFVQNLRTFGEAVQYAKYYMVQCYGHYSTETAAVDFFIHNNNLIGDPSTQAIKRVPQTMTATYPTTIALSTNQISVQVFGANGQPMANAWVTLWQKNTSGADVVFSTDWTDDNGMAYLASNSTLTGTGTLTVTCPQYLPILADVTFGATTASVSVSATTIDDDNSGSSSGNGNSLLNPGETIEYRVQLTNNGTGSLPNVVGVISTSNSAITITDNSENWGTLAVGASAYSSDSFKFTLAGSYNSTQSITFNLHITYGTNSSFDRQLTIPVSSATMSVYTCSVSSGGNNVLDPGETGWLQLTLKNTGNLALAPCSAVISSSDTRISFPTNATTFGSAAVGGTVAAATPLQATAAIDIINGTQIPCILTLTPSGGSAVAVSFNLTVGTVSVSDPLGPDSYGYYAYDWLDTTYDMHPTYAWTEIRPSLGGSGTSLNLGDNGDDEDATATLSLPFAFRFYGVTYAQGSTLSVCSNGWISFGSTQETDFRNTRLPGPGGPSPMIAPFWDDLYASGSSTSNVCYYYDSAQHRLIIEWSQMQLFYYSVEETFQVILYDPVYDPTPTGDGEILCQYKVINNNDAAHNASGFEPGAYCSIGLENQTGLVGLEYTFDNIYPTASHTLANQSAILFTTKTPSLIGLAVATFDVTSEEFTLTEGTAGNATFHIGNTGEAALNYTISKQYVAADDRSQGGPDAFGYTWKDSNETDGPIYDWADISNVGATVSYTADDMFSPEIPLGFNFNFYGTDYSSCYIAANGYITFVTTSTDDYHNTAIPTTTIPNLFIAPYWDDLSPVVSGTVYYYYDTENSRFIIEYLNVPHYQSHPGTYTFEIILKANGDILFQYASIEGEDASSTIGIENADGTGGLQIAYGSTYAANNMAVLIKKPFTVPDWLTVSPTNGSVPVNGLQAINLTADTSQLITGDWDCNLLIATNDSNNLLHTIPVTLHVTGGIITPIAPTRLLISVVNGSPHLTWVAVTEDVNGNQVSNITYKIYRTTLTNPDSYAVEIGTSTTPEFTDTTANPGTNYRYYVTAVHEDTRNSGTVRPVSTRK